MTAGGGTACAVVVDSRNLRGQSRKLFGQGRQTTTSGIVSALAQYGLDAISISVGLATRTPASAVSDRLAEARKKNLMFAEDLRSSGATVLEGNLVERGGRMEEKQVDVLCALAVADYADKIIKGAISATCIVVLSEDMDLMPAYDFAHERGVPVYAAAIDTVHKRPQQREWLLLTEPALGAMCEPSGRKVGSQLRASIAQMAANIGAGDARPPLRWSTVAPTMDDGRALLQSNLGAFGIWERPRRLRPREKVDLYPSGIEIDPHGGLFPFVTLQATPPTSAPDNLLRGSVLFWVSPATAKIRFANGSQGDTSLTAPAGELLPGQEVLAMKGSTGRNDGVYYVGPLTNPPLTPEWPAPDRRAIAIVTAMPTEGRIWANAQLAGGTEILVDTKYLDHCQVGTRLLVVHTGLSAKGIAQAMPLTCCLP